MKKLVRQGGCRDMKGHESLAVKTQRAERYSSRKKKIGHVIEETEGNHEKVSGKQEK